MASSPLRTSKGTNTDFSDDNPPKEALQKKLLAQLDDEYLVAFKHTDTKRATNLRRLKLYNNQKREETKVGDPLLFSVTQTVLASLYEDRLISRWKGREEGDAETAELWNNISEYAYDLMSKDEIDYDWDFDTAFFGRGLLLNKEFDRTNMAPTPMVIDPMTFLRDPRAHSVNGNSSGSGAMRFGGFPMGMTKSELKANKSFFNVDKVQKYTDWKDTAKESKKERDAAQGRDDTQTYDEETLGENYEHQILYWFTTYGGKKYLMGTANGRQLLVRMEKIDNLWPIVDRALFPMAHDWDGVSIPDLIEDKQRARAILINLGLESAKADLYPMYVYNKKKIRNPRLLDFQFNKFVGIHGDTNNAVAPIQKSIFHQQVNLILDILDTASQKAVAAPEVQQGVQPKQDRTLGETQLVQAGSDARHSLGARIFGWSERRFWKMTYKLYEKHMTNSDEFPVRLQGPLGPEFHVATKKEMMSNSSMDVSIDIASNVERERAKQFGEFAAFAQIAMQEPTTNRRFVMRHLGRLQGLGAAILKLMFPPTIDELRAEDENEKIDNDMLPKVNPMDDDIIHIELHLKAEDTRAKIAHIEAHKAMMLYKKEHPENFPPTGPAMPGMTPVNTPTPQPGATTAGAPGKRTLPLSTPTAAGVK